MSAEKLQGPKTYQFQEASCFHRDPQESAAYDAVYRTRLWSDHQKLCAALLEQARLDAAKSYRLEDELAAGTRKVSLVRSDGEIRPGAHYLADVLRWLDAPRWEQATYPFSFAHCCQALNWDEQCTRAAILRRDDGSGVGQGVTGSAAIGQIEP